MMWPHTHVHLCFSGTPYMVVHPNKSPTMGPEVKLNWNMFLMKKAICAVVFVCGRLLPGRILVAGQDLAPI